MRHPTKNQMQRVIDSFKTIEDAANKKGAFDIEEDRVYTTQYDETTYECGTVHCVAGWFAVANIKNKYIKEEIKEGYCNYEDGANLIAKRLGFKSPYELAKWAKENPEIWGNEYGTCMFSRESAYKDLEGSNTPMTAIIQHLEGVRDRLPV